MEDRILQQLKKGVLEMLVLELLCKKPAHGYELLNEIKCRSNGLFALKEGTLYPILYRMEDDGLITSSWIRGEGRSTPKKVYTATPEGYAASRVRRDIWNIFSSTVDAFCEQGD